jgi:hypothetical protein
MTYGVIQVDTVKDSLNNVLAPASAVFRNRIINGAMVIDQRNAGASITPTDTTNGQFSVDRWLAFPNVASKFSIQQNAGSITPPTGYTNYLGVTSLSNYVVGASETFYVRQVIEGYNIADLGWGTANAKTVTLSFWAYSSLTGTFGGALGNSNSNRSYPFSYSIPTANTWTQISITIAGDTTGTWNTTNGSGIRLFFSIGTGSTLSGTAGAWAGATYVSATGATSVVGTSGATFYITGVQLEVGTNATSFDYRPYSTELAMCQRYLPAINSTGTNAQICLSYAYSTTNAQCVFPFIVTPRTAPTGITATVASGFTWQGNTNSSPTSVGFNGASNVVGTFVLSGMSGLAIGSGGQVVFNTTSGQILFTGCEL